MTTPVGYAASAGLGAIAAMHVAWGMGSSFPYKDRATLADSVIGAEHVPPPVACYVVAGALGVASALTADVPVGTSSARSIGRAMVASVLAVRGFMGLGGVTHLVSPGSVSPRFRSLDRRFYSPLCLALSVGVSCSGTGFQFRPTPGTKRPTREE